MRLSASHLSCIRPHCNRVYICVNGSKATKVCSLSMRGAGNRLSSWPRRSCKRSCGRWCSTGGPGSCGGRRTRRTCTSTTSRTTRSRPCTTTVEPTCAAATLSNQRSEPPLASVTREAACCPCRTKTARRPALPVVMLFPLHPSASLLCWAAPASRADRQLRPGECSQAQRARESVQLQSGLHCPARCTAQLFVATQVSRKIAVAATPLCDSQMVFADASFTCPAGMFVTFYYADTQRNKLHPFIPASQWKSKSCRRKQNSHVLTGEFCAQMMFELDDEGSHAVAKMLRALRGPDAVGTSPAECRRVTAAALHDVWHVRYSPDA